MSAFARLLADAVLKAAERRAAEAAGLPAGAWERRWRLRREMEIVAALAETVDEIPAIVAEVEGKDNPC